MLNFLLRTTPLCCLGIAAVVLVAAPSAFASMLDYQAAVQADSSAVVQYSFDGTTAAERQDNGIGTAMYDLTEVDETTEGDITFSTGFDDTSDAFTPFISSANGSLGAAYHTTNTLGLGTSASYEAIVCPASDSGAGYITAAYSGNNDRSYFALADGGAFHARIGANGGTHIISYGADNWYYLAVTMDYDGANTTMNTYYANLSAEDPSLVQTQTNVVQPGHFTSAAAHGIGVLNYAGFSDPTLAYFDGEIDEIVFYDGVKGFNDFDANLGLILSEVPEPGSMVLILTGFFLLFPALKRRSR